MEPKWNEELDGVARRHGVSREALSEFKALMERYAAERVQDAQRHLIAAAGCW